MAQTLSDREIAGAVKAAGFPESQWTVAVAVALAESGGRVDATNRNTNGSTDFGLFQINSIHATKLRTGNWKNPVDNAKMARLIFGEAGDRWTPWSAYKSGRYRMFLGRAIAATGSPVLPGGSSGSTPGANTGLPTPSLTGIGDFLSLVTNPHTWARVGAIIAGGVLIIMAMFKLTGDNQLSPATKSAAKAVIGLAVAPK